MLATFSFQRNDTHIENILKANRLLWNAFDWRRIINELKGSKSSQELKQDIRRQLVYDNFGVQK
jgi:hypothetical protein